MGWVVPGKQTKTLYKPWIWGAGLPWKGRDGSRNYLIDTTVGSIANLGPTEGC